MYYFNIHEYLANYIYSNQKVKLVKMEMAKIDKEENEKRELEKSPTELQLQMQYMSNKINHIVELPIHFFNNIFEYVVGKIL